MDDMRRQKKIIGAIARIVVAGLLGCRFLVSCSKDDQPIPEDTVYRDKTIFSTQMNRTMKYTVWLPKSYDPQKSYPVLYLLHGILEDNNSWIDKGNAREIAREYIAKGGTPMVIVMPDGLTTFHTNSSLGNWESYFHEELMPEVEKTFHCNGKRAVAGFSMGGFGSLYNVLNHPDEFLYGYAMSPDTFFGSAIGDVDLEELVKALKDVPASPFITLESGTDDFIISIESVRAFSSMLRENGVRSELIERPGGHNWDFWTVCLETALDKIGKSLR